MVRAVFRVRVEVMVTVRVTVRVMVGDGWDAGGVRMRIRVSDGT